MTKFIIEGGIPLSGEVSVSGSKNAALPIVAASLLTDEPCEIRNVPDIEDVRNMLGLARMLGSKVSFEKNVVKIHTPQLRAAKLPASATCKMRASALLLGPLLGRLRKAEIPLPGGCVIGRRPFDTHLDAYQQLGAKDFSTGEVLKLKLGNITNHKIILREMSVTATENLLMTLSAIPEKFEVDLAAMEPHVQDLCKFLKKMGAKISGIGTPHLKIHGRKKLRGARHSVTPDYLETGTFVLASLLTRGHILVKRCDPTHLIAFWRLLKEIGAKFHWSRDSVEVFPSSKFNACKRLKTAPYPGFPTDLQAPFSVLLTQCAGISKVHETLFEGRLGYLGELKKMGAKSKIENIHEAFITGPTRLKGAKINSHDIRAGAAMILAALAAKGKTEVNNIEYIDRGYEKLDEKLRNLGARIRRG